MEGQSGQDYLQSKKEIMTDADLHNDETFGLEADTELNEDWEMKHEHLAKLLEIEHGKVKKSSPLRIESKSVDIPTSFHSFNDSVNGTKSENSSDEEEIIVGNTISQLGLDDETDDMVKSNTPSHSFEFQESKESWTSPSRGKDHRPDSLHELISPGEGVWASPSRAMLRSGDHVVPDIDFKKKENEDIIKKLFGGHDIVTAGKGGTTPSNHAIRVEDLERGLRNNGEQPEAVLRRPTPPLMPIPQEGMTPLRQLIPIPPGIMGPVMPPRLPADLNVSPLLLMNRHIMQMGGLPGLPPLYPPLLTPQMMMRPPFFSHDHRRGTPRGRSPWNSNRGRGSSRYNNNDKTWHRSPKQEGQDSSYHDQFIHMESSKMMNAKEKEWIFKISLMSLLSGDPNISDYYFISYMNKKLLKQATEGNKEENEEEDVSENLEKTKQLMNYAQKQQQSKDSHRPVKFEGSLGKLSITSVHHPRQIMDFSTPEQEKTQSRIPESGKKKFVMYGLIEKIYDIFLSLTDVERRLLDSNAEQQEAILQERTAKIDKIFSMLKIQLHTSLEPSDTDHFLHLMSITKSRKLIPRIILYLKQEQSESLLISIIHILPALLKKDNKEQALLPTVDKVKIILKKSSEDFKLKCVKMLRKVNLKTMLSYKMSIRLLSTVLDSLIQKDSSQSLEWSFYETEVPKVLMDLSEDASSRNEGELNRLKRVLNVKDLLINI